MSVQCHPTTAQRAAFHVLGDVNRDGVIDETDLQLIDAAFNSVPGDANWNADADINGDGVVNFRDTSIVVAHLGYDVCSYYGLPTPPIPASGQGTLLINPINENETVDGTISLNPRVTVAFPEGSPEFRYILSLLGTWDYYISPSVHIPGTVTVDASTETGASGHSTSTMDAYIYGWAPDSPNYVGCTCFVNVTEPVFTAPSTSQSCTVHVVGSGDINFNETASQSITVIPYGTTAYSAVTVVVTGTGDTQPTAGEYTYQQGTDLTITTTPQEGWYLAGIKRNGTLIQGSVITDLGVVESIEIIFVQEGQPPPDGDQPPDYTLAGIAVAGVVIAGGAAYLISKRKKKK